MLPIVSIIGRPNVGKSSLFNRMAGRKIAVVDDMPGVTRDRNYFDASWGGTHFTLVDTGGLVPSTHDRLVGSINEQVAVAIGESSVIVFLVEAGAGPTDIDLLIARRLRRQCLDKVILVVNKAESASAQLETGSYMALGCGEPAAISAIHGQGVADLMDRIVAMIAAAAGHGTRGVRDADIAIAVLGRPNAGKSLLVNKLLDKDRMIVDPTPGTTRDSIDSYLNYHKKTVRLIDTAGLRRKSQVKEQLEYYTNVRALESVDRCNVAALMVDASRGIESQDLKILAQILAARKGVVVCLNKWDLVAKDHRTFDLKVAEAREQYHELRHVPILAISALTDLRIRHIIDLALDIQQRQVSRVSAAELRNALYTWARVRPHPVVGVEEVRFLGARQLHAPFPYFVFFCTNPELVQAGYKRYLINNLYDLFEFEGCPMDVTFKPPGYQRRRGASADHADDREDS